MLSCVTTRSWGRWELIHLVAHVCHSSQSTSGEFAVPSSGGLAIVIGTAGQYGLDSTTSLQWAEVAIH